MKFAAFAFLLPLALVGCANNTGRPPASDSGTLLFDASVADTNTPPPTFDSSPPPQDTSMFMPDTSRPDTFVPLPDANTPDTNLPDSGQPDAGGCAACNDNDPCTTDECGPDGACIHTPVDADNDGFPPIGCMGGTDCDDTRSNVNPNAAEVCDGLDNNCDGPADNATGLECAAGSQGAACNTTCGTRGQQSCTSACTWGACVATEVCNGCDDDGDGVDDDGFACSVGQMLACVTTCGTTGNQVCRATCTGYTACSADEVCNGCDDDGDGSDDEDFDCVRGSSAACSVGSCSGTATCSDTCTEGTCDLGAAPPSNTCGNGATTITSSGSYPFATCGASNDYSGSCGGSNGADIAFRVVLAEASDVLFETTAATDFDTVLHLRSGASCPGTEAACNDDITTGNRLSRVTASLQAGTHWVIVDGFNSTALGSGVLSATITPSAPANDECGGATEVDLNLGRTIVNGSTATATNSSASCDSGADVWYSFELFEPEVVYIHTFGSAIDTVVGITDFACGAPGQCNDDACTGLQSSLVRALNVGTHFIVVDGAFADTAGDFTLTIEHLPLGNTLAADPIAQGTSMVDGTTAGIGVLDDCRIGDAPEDAYYWTQCPGDAGGFFELDTCDALTTLDSVVYLWSGATGLSLACNDDDLTCTISDGGYISATIPGGAGLHMAYVDGFDDEAGTYRAHFVRP